MIYTVYLSIYLYTCTYTDTDIFFFCQHAHIENIKTVAILTNNKDVFMCILLFHARAGYLQTYETLLKLFSSLPGSDKSRTSTL